LNFSVQPACSGLRKLFLFRNVLGTKCLAEILSEREQIAHWMETTLDEATDPWGVKVERVEM
jgi:erythrocyte band 7 integral membrane protein